MTDLTTERATELGEPAPAPRVPDPDEWAPPEPPVVPPDGVELTRLLALVRLSAPQAVELSAGVLTAAAGRAGGSGPGSAGDLDLPEEAFVCADGRVLLRPAPDGGPDRVPPARVRSRATLAAVLADVAGAARFRGRPADPSAEQLLDALDTAASDLPDVGVPAVAARLQAVVAGIERDAVRCELGALVRAVGDRAASARGPAPLGASSTVVRTAPARRARAGESGAALRRIGAWLVSVLVLAAVVAVEVVVLRDDIAADVDLLMDAGRGEAASSPESQPDGRPVEPPAPAAAGSVAAVDLRSMVPCAPAAPCTLRLQVRLLPGPDVQTVTWSYQVIDRCTGGAVGTVPGGTVTVPAGGRLAAAVGTVALPDQPGVAVVAVTSLPAVAASPPVLTGSCPSDQPTG